MSPFFLVPVQLDEGMTVSHMFAGPMRCGAPVVIGLRGTHSDAAPIAVVGYEWPERFNPHRTSEAKERQHLARFELDHAAGLGERRYTTDPARVPTGADPPDFVCERNGRSVGVELTQLLLGERAEMHAILGRLAQLAMAVNRDRWRRLAGRIAYVSFTDGPARRPPKDEPDLQLVVRELRSVVPVDPLYDKLPDQIDPAIVHQFAGGTIVTAPLDADPGSPFYRFTGFELGFAFTTVIRQEDAWDRARRLVTTHDRPGVDELIISAGAPTKQGLAFPSDGVLASLVLGAAQGDALQATHIQRIFVHSWQGRGIAALTPNQIGFKLICGEMPGA